MFLGLKFKKQLTLLTAPARLLTMPTLDGQVLRSECGGEGSKALVQTQKSEKVI